jgi:STE24 endopeptidase
VQLGYKDKLAEALIKLQMKNLSAMDADPLYSAFTYTHPILPERLRALGWQGEAKS